MKRKNFLMLLFVGFFSFFKILEAKIKGEEEYHLIYWFDEMELTNTITFDSLDEANEEYDRLLKGGKLHRPRYKEDQEPEGLKLVKTLRGFTGSGDLTKRGKAIEASWEEKGKPVTIGVVKNEA